MHTNAARYNNIIIIMYDELIDWKNCKAKLTTTAEMHPPNARLPFALASPIG